MYNSLLARQIRKHLSGNGEIPSEFLSLLEAINASYNHFETDRKLIERSMDISSDELLDINNRLRREAERQKVLLAKLRESLKALDPLIEFPEEKTSEENLIGIADLLRKQIEQRRQAEDRLRRSEEQFRLIAENASDIIVHYDAEGICTYISPSCLPILGYEQGELIGKTPFDLMHPEDVPVVKQQLEDSMHRHVRFTIDARMQRKEGNYRWFESSVHPLFDEETGELTEIHTAARDITERKESEETILALSSRLETLVQSLEGGVLVEDEHRHIAVINQRFCDMFGIPAPPAALLGTDCSQAAEMSKGLFVEPEEFVERITWILAEQRPVVGDELYLVDGRAFERSYAPIFIDQEYSGHLWHYRDITERKKSEEAIRELNNELQKTNQLLKVERDREKEHVKALQKLNAMKNEFVSSVSHELRTPLASIIGFAQTLLIDPDLPLETRSEFLQIVHDEGKRLAKLINDLLDIARIESGRAELEKREGDLIPLLQRAVQSVALQADAKNIHMGLETDAQEIIFEFDPDRLSQVVVNLLGNAVKFTPEGGNVTLRAEEDEQEIRIIVSDTGLGIPADDLPHLFEKFYRVHRPGLDIRGTGLGLAIVHQLVELHGGRIEVESSENEGSTFTIRLFRN